MYLQSTKNILLKNFKSLKKEITYNRGFSPVNLVHICGTPIYKNTFEGVLPTWFNLPFKLTVCSRFII